MQANIGINSTEFRAAFLRSCIADAYISLMLRINGEAVYIEDGERIELTPERVAMNILYHIEAPWINEFGQEEGHRLACDVLERMLSPGYMAENIRLSAFGVSELREVYRDIVFGAPDGEVPPGFSITTAGVGEVLL
ncbi:TPA: hypothetical protein ACH1O5_004892 [Enterobacter roggenkampii]|jgi:hypothetical protein|uniref:hypothetical protein n=1 Tax=Enterobacter cloacae complex TaxID=354276 RepID=UPI00123C7196|nr:MULTISPECIES: hypothetical protein [Enterobacter cloacae complex]MCK7050934.1 hypothetical protein [Enterobacter roggenkampii]QLV81664.1 hypothetical protein HV263_04385 [Enterobacter cloacae]DAH07985.1 MAG TPA: protein of unknown function (DUF5375) [Caudoviricetes sp.]